MSDALKAPKFQWGDEVFTASDPDRTGPQKVDGFDGTDWSYLVRDPKVNDDEGEWYAEEGILTKAEFIAARLAELRALGWPDRIECPICLAHAESRGPDGEEKYIRFACGHVCAKPVSAPVRPTLPSETQVVEALKGQEFARGMLFAIDNAVVTRSVHFTQENAIQTARILRNAGLCDGGDPHAKALAP